MLKNLGTKPSSKQNPSKLPTWRRVSDHRCHRLIEIRLVSDQRIADGRMATPEVFDESDSPKPSKTPSWKPFPKTNGMAQASMKGNRPSRSRETGLNPQRPGRARPPTRIWRTGSIPAHPPVRWMSWVAPESSRRSPPRTASTARKTSWTAKISRASTENSPELSPALPPVERSHAQAKIGRPTTAASAAQARKYSEFSDKNPAPCTKEPGSSRPN